MLQNMREKSQGLMTWVIVLLIIGAFAFFGLTDYFQIGDNKSFAARVNGEKISWKEVATMTERLSRQYGNQVDPNTLKEQVRTGLVQRTALMHKAKALGYQVGDQQIANALLQIPAFQVDGKFSKERYIKILSEASYTDIGFRKELSHDILLGQLEQGLTFSSFTLPVELNQTIALLDQKRDFGYLSIPAKHYEKNVLVSAEDIKSFYENHKTNFVKPEQVSVEYLELSVDELAKQVVVSKDEVLAYYNEHQSSYSAPERVRVRHILISAPKEDATADKEANKKAESLLVQLKEKNKNFSDLAKENSADPGSAEKGGDLGWFTRGQMVPEFEQAAFELKKTGEISGLVRTQYGYHILQLVERKNAEVRPFKETESLVEEQLKREKAQLLFAEKGEQLAKLAFEQTDALASVAEQLGLKLKNTELFSKEGGQKGISSNPEFVKAAFSDVVLKQRHNSEPIKLTDSATAILRLKTHEPAVQQTLELVKNQIKERLTAEAAKLKIKELGEAIVKRIQNGSKPIDIAKEQKLEWKTKSGVSRMPSQDAMDRNIVMAVFQMSSESTAEKPAVKGFNLPTGDYIVLAVTQIKPGDLSKLDQGTQNAYRQSFNEVSSQLEFSLYANQVLKESKIQMSKEKEA